MQLDTVTGNIQLNKIDFSYDSNDYLLRNLSISIKPGEIYCISGANGNGKLHSPRYF